jgi:hypothetical protein
MMSLSNYLGKDFSTKSTAASELFERLDDEASRRAINLTPVYSTNGVPPYLTPAMESWYRAYIQPLRWRAIDEVSGQFESKSVKKSKGFLFEKERDANEQRTLHEINNERETFLQRQAAEYLSKKLPEKREEYDAMRREQGRDAQKWTPAFYWTILFAWMVPEFLINWESFAKIPVLLNTPALVLGSVTLVASFFAVSSHILGTLWKQRQDRFGGAVSATDRKKNRLELILALFLFLLAMGIVVWGRYLLMSDIIREKTILRGQGLELEDVLYTIGAILGNIGVWIAGIWWSYTKHDSVPNFSELRTEVERLESKKRKLCEKYLSSRNQRHILAGNKRFEQLKRLEEAQAASLNGYREARERFGELLEKDQEVSALLGEYKARLVSKVASKNPDAIFLIRDIRKADIDDKLQYDADEFASTLLLYVVRAFRTVGSAI